MQPIIDTAIPENKSGWAMAGSVVQYGPIGQSGSMQNGSDCIWGINTGSTTSTAEVMMVPAKNIQCERNRLDAVTLLLIDRMAPATRHAMPA